MIDQKVKAYLIDAIKRKASVWDLEPSNVQILIQLNEAGVPQFTYCKQFNAKEGEETDVETILNLELDVMGLCQIVPAFIQTKMIALTDELSVPLTRLSAIIILDNNDLIIWLYDRDKPIKSLTLNELLS